MNAPEPDNPPLACPPDTDFGIQLQRARAGDTEAMGQLLQRYRSWLLSIAKRDFDPALKGKLGASDIVQESMLTAHQVFREFAGNSEPELRAWLRRILLNDVYQSGNRFRATKRRASREQSLGDAPTVDQTMGGVEATPLSRVTANEEARLLDEAMLRLDPEHRRVIQLRSWEEKSFAETGEEMNRSADAARKLWTRAILALQKALHEPEQKPPE